MNCSPQRFLANDRNVLRTASLVASSVLPVENQVLALPFARKGTAQAVLRGLYTGQEQADYEFEILDNDADVARVSKPTFTGEGSGTMEQIAASGVPQVFTVECAEAGIPGAAAAVTVDGAVIHAATEGADGNDLNLTVDQSGLTFTDTNFTTLVDLEAGKGSAASPLIGQGFDWNTVQIDANGIIPDDALRIAFKDDPSQVYLNYKKFIDGNWQYFLIPGLARSVPKGTRIQTVTGGRTVTVDNGVDTPETQFGIVTDYDFLSWIRTTSTLLVVDGPVVNDRTPTGQAAHEFSLRTDAHAEVSGGTGSTYARSLQSVSVAADAGTQLIRFTCYAVTPADNPNARLGHELWEVESSLTGKLGTAVTGVPFSSTAFTATVPVRLPPGFGQDKGSIGAHVEYTGRDEDEIQPPICVAGLALGPAASDKSVTFRYTAPPSGDCDCSNLPVPGINPFCLGIPSEGGESVSYLPDTVDRLIDLYDWYEGLVRDLTEPATNVNSATGAPAIERPADGLWNAYNAQFDDATAPVAVDDDGVIGSGSSTVYVKGNPNSLSGGPTMTPASYANFIRNSESIQTVVSNFEQALALIDPLEDGTGSYREAGCTAWDAAVVVFQTDIATMIGASSPFTSILNIPSERYAAALKKVLMTAGISTLLGKIDASTVRGDGCWRDFPDAPRWVDTAGVYAPLFNNLRWYFVRRTTAGAYFSTHEATGIINVKCESDLKYGDEITITIQNAGYGATYQAGDVLELPIVAAGPRYLTGGVDPAPVQTWNVNSSVTGPFGPYTFNPDSPSPYSGGAGGSTLAFLLVVGGIPYAKGDRYAVSVEGGHFRWRKNGGAWDGSSPALSIPLVDLLIDEGLSLSFTAGALTSFIAGDVYKFRALQPWAVSNLQTPNARVWKADGETAEIAFDLGSAQDWTMFAMLHSLPADATVELWGGATSGATDFSDVIEYRDGIMRQTLARNARYGRLVISVASGETIAIAWAWLGDPLSTSLSADVLLRRSYLVKRPGGNLQGGRFGGKAVSGDVSWSQVALNETDVDGLTAMLDHVKEQDDEPILFIPQVTRPEILLARINSDEVDLPDLKAYNQDIAFERRVSASLPLEGVWR